MVQARRIAQCALLVCALLIAGRTLFGPSLFKSPMNVEGWFGLSAILLAVLPSRTRQETNSSTPNRWDAFAALGIALLVAAAFCRTAPFYFLSDDFILLKYASQFSYNFHTLFATAGGDGFYRPLTYASMALTSAWAGTDPAHWHWIGFALHASNSILVFFVARTMGLQRLASAFAAALFAVHASRPEAVIWVATRSDLLATFFVLIALLSFIISWNESRWCAVLRVVSLLAMFLAFLSKESSYTFPLVLFVFLIRELKSRRAWYALAPFFALAASMLAWRWTLFGGIGGYLNAAGQPQALSPGLLPVIKTLALRLWAVLFFPINWSREPGVLLGILMILYLAALLWLLRSRAEIFVPIGILIVLSLPPLTQLLIGPDLQKARFLYLPSLGFCLLLATLAQHLKTKSQWIISTTIVAFNLAALFHNMDAWDYASQKARKACSVAARCAPGTAIPKPPGSLNGVYFFANGFPECVELNQSFDLAQSACVLTWDAATDELSTH